MSVNVRTAKAAFVTLMLGLLFAPAAQAQSILDAGRIEFTPSTDHGAVDTGGAALVQSYTLDIFRAGATQALQTVALGKPTPESDGMIRMDFVSLLSTPLLGGVTYEARVSAVGPGGVGVSLPSNTFGFSQACAPSLSATSQAMTASGGSGSVSVAAGTGCAWTAVSNAAWITVTSGASGSGNGSVAFSVAATTATANRSGTLTIAGSTYTVTQAGAACTFSVSPSTQTIGAAGGTASLTVTTTAGCAWSASSTASWAPVTGGASGTASGTVTVSVATQTATALRTATINVAGRSVSVEQSGATGCAFSLSPASASVGQSGGAVSVAVTTTAGCAWTAVSGASWASVVIGAAGTGSGTVSLSVNVNTATGERTATVTIGGQSLIVTQSGSCSFVVSPLAVSAPSAGVTSGAASVTTQAGCAWTSTTATSWLTVLGSGTGSGSITYTVGRNPSGNDRTGTLAVAGKSIVVTQAKLKLAAPGRLRVKGIQ